MITGKFKNEMLFAPAYVISRKDLVVASVSMDARFDWACPVYVAGSVPVLNGYIYFAWVMLKDGRSILKEFNPKELYLSARSAEVEHWAEWDRQGRLLMRMEQARPALYRYARCYHHTARKKAGFVKNFLAKMHQACAHFSFPVRYENAPGVGTLPTPTPNGRNL